MKKIQDWKLILNTNNYHSIFVKHDNMAESLSKLYENFTEISQIPQYCLLLPAFHELQVRDPSQYIAKFAPLLKEFAENEVKKTLITEQGVLHTLIKEEKRVNFFKFLVKQKKNILLFCQDDCENYVADFPQGYRSLVMDYEQWYSNLTVLDRFEDIKTTVTTLPNPFKNPFEAFKSLDKKK